MSGWADRGSGLTGHVVLGTGVIFEAAVDPRPTLEVKTIVAKITGIALPRARAYVEIWHPGQGWVPAAAGIAGSWRNPNNWRRMMAMRTWGWRVVLDTHMGFIHGGCPGCHGVNARDATGWAPRTGGPTYLCCVCHGRGDTNHERWWRGDSLRVGPGPMPSLRAAVEAAQVHLDEQLSIGAFVVRVRWLQCTCSSDPWSTPYCVVHCRGGVGWEPSQEELQAAADRSPGYQVTW